MSWDHQATCPPPPRFRHPFQHFYSEFSPVAPDLVHQVRYPYCSLIADGLCSKRACYFRILSLRSWKVSRAWCSFDTPTATPLKLGKFAVYSIASESFKYPAAKTLNEITSASWILANAASH